MGLNCAGVVVLGGEEGEHWHLAQQGLSAPGGLVPACSGARGRQAEVSEVAAQICWAVRVQQEQRLFLE